MLLPVSFHGDLKYSPCHANFALIGLKVGSIVLTCLMAENMTPILHQPYVSYRHK